MVHAHAAGALQQRFDDQGADFAGVRVQQVGQGVGGTLGAGDGLGLVARTEGIRRRREQRLQQQRRIHAAVQRDVTHRQRAQRLAVVAAGQRHEPGAPFDAAVVEPVEGHLQRHFHPGRPVVGVEHLGQRVPPGLAWGDRQQALGQFDGGRVRAAGQDHLLQGARLPGDGLGDARLGMAVQVGPPAADAVEDAPAVEAHQPGAFAARHGEQRQRVRVLAHLRAGVPEHRQVACPPVIRGGYHGVIVKSFHPAIIAAGATA